MSGMARRVAITGGAGGIGEALVARLARSITGRIGLFDLDRERMQAIARRHETDRLHIACHPTDLCDTAALTDAIGRFAAGGAEQAPGIDIVFANAGAVTSTQSFERAEPGEIARSVALNFGSVVQTARAAWDALVRAKGNFVVTASGAGLHPIPGDPVYGASKAADVMFVRTCALRAGETGIRFNALCPGVVRTAMLCEAGSADLRPEIIAFTRQYALIEPAEVADALFDLGLDPAVNGSIVEIRNPRNA